MIITATPDVLADLLLAITEGAIELGPMGLDQTARELVTLDPVRAGELANAIAAHRFLGKLKRVET